MASYPLIAYRKDGSYYEAQINVTDMTALAKLTQQNNLYGMSEDENFVSSLISLAKGAGILSSVLLKKDGAVHDGPDGQPASQRYTNGVAEGGISVVGTTGKDLKAEEVQNFSVAPKTQPPANKADGGGLYFSPGSKF